MKEEDKEIILCFYITAQNEDFDVFAYIGLIDVSGNSTEWQWVSDNSSLTFSNWGPMQPQPANIVTCVITPVFPTEGIEAIGLWENANCIRSYNAVCETDRVSDYHTIILFLRGLLVIDDCCCH